MQTELQFLDKTIKEDLIYVVTALIEHKPVSQLTFISDWLERLATATEKSSERIEVSKCAKLVEEELSRVNRLDLNYIETQKAHERAHIESIQRARDEIIDVASSDMDCKQLLASFVVKVPSLISCTTCYVAQVSGDSPNRIVSYPFSNGDALQQIVMNEDQTKGVSWKLLASESSSLYLKNAMEEPEIHWLLGEPRPGALLLIKFIGFSLEGTDMVESQYIFGLDTVGKSEEIKRDMIEILEQACEVITSRSKERCLIALEKVEQPTNEDNQVMTET